MGLQNGIRFDWLYIDLSKCLGLTLIKSFHLLSNSLLFIFYAVQLSAFNSIFITLFLLLYFHYLNVNIAFFNGKLQEKLYMHLPYGIEDHSNRLVCFHYSIYGLKQTFHIQNQLLDSKLKKIGFYCIHTDYYIYVFCQKGYITFLAIYVDNMDLLSNNFTFMQKIKNKIEQCFCIKDLGWIHQLLGIAIEYNFRAQTI